MDNVLTSSLSVGILVLVSISSNLSALFTISSYQSSLFLVMKPVSQTLSYLLQLWMLKTLMMPLEVKITFTVAEKWEIKQHISSQLLQICKKKIKTRQK